MLTDTSDNQNTMEDLPPLGDSAAMLSDEVALRARMQRDGYLFISGLLNVTFVQPGTK